MSEHNVAINPIKYLFIDARTGGCSKHDKLETRLLAESWIDGIRNIDGKAGEKSTLLLFPISLHHTVFDVSARVGMALVPFELVKRK